ncbi:MAG: FecR family protein [Acholeplasmatales bacterium]|nr:FecR family protein [Acholeplasmatales bacterium]
MKKLISVLCILISLMLCIFLSSCGDEEPTQRLIDSARTIKVVQIEGSANVSDENETLDCFKGMNLYDGDKLHTTAGSVVVVKFDEDKYVYFGENTTVNIKSEGTDTFKTNIFVEGGIVLAEIQNKLGVDEEFFLSSNNSVMAVRGTIFGVEVVDNGSEYVETYSVYKGVTELFVFDQLGDSIIKGKLTDISNKKVEIKVPKDKAISNDSFNDILDNWLEDVDDKFNNPEDANEKLDEVSITVGTPTEEDYGKVIDVIGGISYSSIEYTSEGYFGNYDGEGHSISVVPNNINAQVFYKGEGESEYKDTNDYVFYAPGSYRVYYKIVCEGFADKEDYEVIIITKPNITFTSHYFSIDPSTQSTVLDISLLSQDFNFTRYNGVNFDVISEGMKYYIAGKEVEANSINVGYNYLVFGFIELVDGKNTISLSIEFDDYTINTEAYFYFIDDRDDPGYSVSAYSSDVEELGGNLYYINSSSSMFLSGTNPNTSVKVLGTDLLAALGIDVQDDRSIYINLTSKYYSSVDKNLAYQSAANNFEFNKNEYCKVDILSFPTSHQKGYNDVIYIYISDTKPTNNPTYTIGSLNYVFNPSKTPNGVMLDFVESDNDVTYSLDGITYNSTLYINEPGKYPVYFKVSNPSNPDMVIEDTQIVSIVTGDSVIAFDAQKFITSPIHILSNDNNELGFKYMDSDGIVAHDGILTIENGDILTSLDNAYLIYSNMIKNAKFYDSITKEEINVTVTISEKRKDSANFNYSISADGYATVNGVVKFDYSEIGTVPYNSNDYSEAHFEELNISLPMDYTVSLSEVSTVIPTRTVLSIENTTINYQTYYSIDEGATWTEDAPKIKSIGEYKVYTLYCFVDKGNDATDLANGSFGEYKYTDLAANGNFIIAVQNITVEA